MSSAQLDAKVTSVYYQVHGYRCESGTAADYLGGGGRVNTGVRLHCFKGSKHCICSADVRCQKHPDGSSSRTPSLIRPFLPMVPPLSPPLRHPLPPPHPLPPGRLLHRGLVQPRRRGGVRAVNA